MTRVFTNDGPLIAHRQPSGAIRIGFPWLCPWEPTPACLCYSEGLAAAAGTAGPGAPGSGDYHAEQQGQRLEVDPLHHVGEAGSL